MLCSVRAESSAVNISHYVPVRFICPGDVYVCSELTDTVRLSILFLNSEFQDTLRVMRLAVDGRIILK
jgi:hypothetical protein